MTIFKENQNAIEERDRLFHNSTYNEHFSLEILPVSKKKFTRLASYGIKRLRTILKTDLLVNQPMANLDKKTLCGKMTRL